MSPQTNKTSPQRNHIPKAILKAPLKKQYTQHKSAPSQPQIHPKPILNPPNSSQPSIIPINQPTNQPSPSKKPAPGFVFLFLKKGASLPGLAKKEVTKLLILMCIYIYTPNKHGLPKPKQFQVRNGTRGVKRFFPCGDH